MHRNPRGCKEAAEAHHHLIAIQTATAMIVRVKARGTVITELVAASIEHRSKNKTKGFGDAKLAFRELRRL